MEASRGNAVEVRAFGRLYLFFQDRGWENPVYYDAESSLTAEELLQRLDIPSEDVEAVFVNHRVRPLETEIKNGDRVAFVPPGIPSIHRFNLGFYNYK